MATINYLASACHNKYHIPNASFRGGRHLGCCRKFGDRWEDGNAYAKDEPEERVLLHIDSLGKQNDVTGLLYVGLRFKELSAYCMIDYNDEPATRLDSSSSRAIAFSMNMLGMLRLMRTTDEHGQIRFMISNEAKLMEQLDKETCKNM